MAHILTIQSHVVYGHAGNAAAVFPMQRLGHQVSILNLLQFSNHTGYGSWGGRALSAEELRDVLQGLEKIGVFQSLDAIISGYIGSVEQVQVIYDTIQAIKKQRPSFIYYCDPVMGDDGRGLYVKPEIATFIQKQLIQLADWITPNAFELSQLTNIAITNTHDALRASQQLVSYYNFGVLATSIADSPQKTGLLLTTKKNNYHVETPKYDLIRTVHGTGDVTAATFISHLLHGDAPVVAMEKTANTMDAITQLTFKQGLTELAIIAAQEAIAYPDIIFKAKEAG